MEGHWASSAGQGWARTTEETCGHEVGSWQWAHLAESMRPQGPARPVGFLPWGSRAPLRRVLAQDKENAKY